MRLPALVALLSLVALPVVAAVGPGGSSSTATTSEMRSATASVTSANPAIASMFSGPLAGPNAAAFTAFLPSTSFTKTTTSQGFDTSITFSDEITGPIPIPIGVGPGTANCTGVPAVFGSPIDTGKLPYPECDYTGYQIYVVQPGTVNVNTDEHFVDDYSIVIDSAALSWLEGSLHASIPNALIDDGLSFIDGLLKHGAASSGLMFSAEPLAFQAGSLWTPALDSLLALFGASASAPADIDAWFAAIPRSSTYADASGVHGFATGGIMLAGGLDLVDGPWRYGVAFSLEGTQVVENTTADSGGIGTVRAGAYAAYDIEDWTLSGAVAAGLHRIDTTRFALLPDPSTASYGAATFTAGFAATGHYDLGAASFEPTAGILFTTVATDAFTETGPFGIAGQGAVTSSLVAYAGGRLSTEIADADGRVWTPDVHGRVSYDLIGDARSLTATFTGATVPTPFVVTGITPSPVALALGTALQVEFGEGYLAAVGYDAMIRSGALAHSAALSARGSF